MKVAYIGIGSNVGDRAAHLALARERLDALRGTRVTAFSSIHETEPVGPVPMDRFLNAAAEVRTELAPDDLWRALTEIEQAAGRVRTIRWGPRTLDLDLLLYGDQVIHTPELTVPHPHLHERTFVLEPLAEIAADVRHPQLERTIRELLAALNADE